MDNPLDVTPWVVELDPDTGRAYALMREAEDAWLQDAEAKGCQLHYLPHDRRVVVLVPPDTALPDHAAMANTRAEYADRLRQLAAEQGKKSGVGARSASMPHWVGGEGKEAPLGADRPEYEAFRVTYRTQTAYRAGQLTAEQALDYLRRRRDRQEEVLNNAVEQYRKDRIDRLEDRLEEVDQAYQAAADFLQRNTAVNARLVSGVALKITVAGRDVDGKKVGFTSSLPAIALVPAAQDCTVEPAPTRNRAGRVRVLARFDNVEFYQS